MDQVGQRERRTQNRIVSWFRSYLAYDYLGDWQDREHNTAIEESYLTSFLHEQGYSPRLIDRAIAQLQKAANIQGKGLYQANKAVYSLLRYGVKVREELGEPKETVWLIDWEHPERNHFAIAEEVTLHGVKHTKRPDIVIYVNGLALGVIELKRASVAMEEGIRQNLLNQQEDFIPQFFVTQQVVAAGNDSQGLRYGTIETSEKYYLEWKEPSEIENLLDRHIAQLFQKERLLEIVHDFIVFDKGIKKLCRHNQYFGIKAAQERILQSQGGIIWHTQGSGKSLTMVWLTKWIKEHVDDARVLIITDRTELDEQIAKVFAGVDEEIHRSSSGGELLKLLNKKDPWLLCSLVHKFGSKKKKYASFAQELSNRLPKNFSPKGELFVFVDECHRTQSGLLHKAMKKLLPGAVFVGFTGTPLLKKDKQKSIEVFGTYIHTYKFDEAVSDEVVLDLRYEARDIEQWIGSQRRIDEWFESKTKGLSDYARQELKRRWGTMQKVLSSRDRLARIVDDIMLDFDRRDRLQNGKGNAMLVAGSIYQACRYYEMFQQAGFKKCAIITSYVPSTSDIKNETTGEEGYTEKLLQYEIYQQMLAGKDPELFEKDVKKLFVEEPAQMKLLIVVDKLLTGFDAPAATYLYIDKKMQDHGLFQAICRVNRLDGEDKEFGYIIDYKDLFASGKLEGAISDYTHGAFEDFDDEDVKGLLKDRLISGREKLEEARETIKALCEPIYPKEQLQYHHYFCGRSLDKDSLKETESQRHKLYKYTVSLIRAYANLANEMEEAGYSHKEAEEIKAEVKFYTELREEIKKRSGDY
ncbi:MAG: HsdR family type I site-specific deoxyribonuclease, partial [Bacteroidota bacterium]